jgi:hypothetical protein
MAAKFSLRMAAHVGLAIFALAGGTAADPIGALVESLTGKLSDVAVMDYVRAGQVIRLGADQIIVLSYGASCVRETITGGTVIIGTKQSEVKSGEVQRSKERRCDVGRMEQFKGDEAGRIQFKGDEAGGRTFRGPH